MSDVDSGAQITSSPTSLPPPPNLLIADDISNPRVAAQVIRNLLDWLHLVYTQLALTEEYVRNTAIFAVPINFTPGTPIPAGTSNLAIIIETINANIAAIAAVAASAQISDGRLDTAAAVGQLTLEAGAGYDQRAQQNLIDKVNEIIVALAVPSS